MKAFLVLFAFAFMSLQSVSAQELLPLVKNDVGLYPARGKLTSVKPICPKIPGRPSCMAVGSTATITVKLSGCVDRLAGHFSKFEVIDGHGVLYFGGMVLSNKDSRSARCVAAPFETISIGLPFEGEVELVNLDYSANLKPEYM